MRLWHKDLIPYLPNQQLVAQWRELNAIYRKQPKHILINYIYTYDKIDLLNYSCLVILQMKKRNFNLDLKNYYEYFRELYTCSKEPRFNFGMITIEENCPPLIFNLTHNEDYLKICCWNLYEKYLRGQKGFTPKAIQFIESVIK